MESDSKLSLFSHQGSLEGSNQDKDFVWTVEDRRGRGWDQVAFLCSAQFVILLSRTSEEQEWTATELKNSLRYDVYNVGTAVDVASREILLSLASGDTMTVEFAGTGPGQLSAVFCVSSLVISQ